MGPPTEFAARDLAPLLGVLVVGAALLWSLRRDPRALRNGVLVVLLVHYLLGSVALLTARSTELEVVTGVVLLAVAALVGLGLALLPLLLVVDGVLVLRRESRSLANALSLLAGLSMIGFPVVLVALLRHENPVTGALAVGLLTAQACAGLLFLAFATHTALYAWLARRAEARAVIVLGAGLVGGEVSPLLAARLRRAVTAVEERRRRTGALPIVPSGGQGPDEPRAEGVAMAEWLRRHGIADEDVLVEGRSRNTRENLRFSARLLEQRGVPGPYLIVTSNYHAPRAALLARRLGIDAQAIGCPTALYYWPSAYLREFVAVMLDHRALLALSGLAVVGMAGLAGLSLAAA
ncbi:YdcF family protein [Modestobacter sp. KNN46-3]|uniref:YdcF family protein n=1 Tax=Modestobacter sp. KNN46-3 TaxID=2711218 RepID=UPI0019CF78F8|nr:YdcF family protein [Modestobacter sp. KNN46-3]